MLTIESSIKEAPSAASDCTSVANYLSGKNVFITGGTGFLGTVTIEALLSASPDIGNIYVLVRSKKGFTPESRVEQMLTKALFIKHSAEVKAKVKPVVGELTEVNYGLKGEQLENLLNNVNIVYHGAATIKFNTFLGTAIKINLIGTQVAINFAKSLKNLSSFIYLSTAFCNSNMVGQGVISEKIYKSEKNPYDMIKLVDTNNNENEIILPQCGSQELKDYIGGHPNTYTFTKQLAENLIEMEMQNMPAGIVRPSVVYGTYKHPEGWVGSANNGHLGFLAGFSKGVFRTMGGLPRSKIDLIPCDYVVNSTLVLSWYVGTRTIETPEVIHCTSGEINPLNIATYCKALNIASEKNPNDFIVATPKVKVRNGLRYTIFFYMFHIIPALLLYLPETYLPVKLPARKMIDYAKTFDKGVKAFAFFVTTNFRYSVTNSLKVLAHLNQEDAVYYNFNAKFLDWYEFLEIQIKGMRFYFFKESRVTTNYHKIMYQALRIVQHLWYILGFVVIRKICLYLVSDSISMAIAIAILLFIKLI